MDTEHREDKPMDSTLRIESNGHLCSTLQVPYHRIRKAYQALSIEPAAIINGIVHFNESQIDQIAAHIKATSKVVA